MRFIYSLLLSLTCISSYGQDIPYSNQIYGGSSNGIVGKIDDEFSVTPNGQTSYEIPIPTVPGTGGMTPKLSVTYNSSTKDGLLGYGFDLTGLPVISRVPKNMHDDGSVGYVSFSSNDRFALDGNRLVLERVIGYNRYEYRTKVNTFSKIVAEGDRYSPTSFTVYTKDGLIYEFKSDNYLLGQSSWTNSVFWFVTKVKDTKGNYFTVTYGGDTSDNDVYPTRIDFTGNDNASLSPYASVRINYTLNSYAPTTYIYGKAVRHGKHISSIGIYYGESPVRNYTMQYQTVNYKRQLIRITETASDGTKKNPTEFTWSNLSSFALSEKPHELEYLTQFNNVILTVGDFNGDGKSDVMTMPYNSASIMAMAGSAENYDTDAETMAKDSVLVSEDTLALTGKATLQADMKAASSWQYRVFSGGTDGLTLAYIGTESNSDAIIQMVSADFTGDGLDDVITVQKSTTKYYNLYMYKAVPTATGISMERSGPYYWSKNAYTVHPVELNGDGAADIFLHHNNSKDYATLCSSYQNNSFIMPLYTRTTATAADKWDRVEFVDFDGDGLTEVMNLNSNGYKLFKSDGNGNLATGNTSIWPKKEHHLYFGDLNGDGKTDMLLTGYDNDPNSGGWSQWQIHYSKGDGSFQYQSIPRQFLSSDKKIILTDLNGDGFDDYYAIAKTSSSGATVRPVVYLNDGTGATFQQVQGAWVAPLDKWKHYFGDINGDGKTDIICTANWTSTTWSGYKLYEIADTPNSLLTSITDGLGNTTEITYKYMSDNMIYQREYTYVQYPLCYFGSSWPLVYQVKTPNGIGGQNTTTYRYKNALLHKRGKGVLGFKEMTVKDETTNTETVTQMEVETSQYLTAVNHSETWISIRKMAETTNINQLKIITTAVGDSTYNYVPVKTYESKYDYGSGNLISSTTTETEYDNYGNATQIKRSGNGENIETVNTYVNDTGNWFLGRLTQSTVSTYNSTKTSRFEYDEDSGLLTAEYAEPDNPKGIKKTYLHDAFGNITQSTTHPVADNSDTRTETTVYDSKGRFITSHTDALGFMTLNTIEEARGLLLTSTDANNITTTNTYDAFGRNIQSSTPIATAHAVTGWSNGMTDAPTNALYFQYADATGDPYTIEFFDCLGRSIRKVTESVDGRKIYVDVVYNEKGLVEKTSEPYFPGDAVYWNTNQYDATGRVIRQTAPDGSYYTMQYSGLTTTTTDPLGHSSIKTMSAKGLLQQSTDADGTSTTYSYDNRGNCTYISGPHTYISMGYDIFGNKISSSASDIGNYTYEYNAFGELTQSQHGSDTPVTYTYDEGGRVVTETLPEMTVTTTYDTRFNGAVSRIESTNGHSIDYYYDAYGRVIREEEVINNKTFITQTTYNALGKVDVVTYPSGLRVRNLYSDNGILTSVKNADSNYSYWTLDTLNARGQIERETLGNGLGIRTAYNAQKGYVERITTPSLISWSYGYNTVGNLTSRKDNLRDLTETFAYDNLDRLITVKKNGMTTQEMTYDEAGNILSKSDVGSNFEYGSYSNRLQAFTSTGYQPKQWDNIQYSSFNKITHLTMGTSSLNITYGVDKSRILASQTVGGVTENRYYIGNIYEEKEKNDTITKINYIFASGKAIAIFETKAPGDSTLLFIHHDQLGSINAYSDVNGILVQELSYDAWGRRRNPETWAYYTDILDAGALDAHGFTGHEHIDLFEVVNMDGRMYDPVIGRFLSPDPIIQSPDFSQSLNRYAYCLNNPLSLVDPSGYSWFSKNWKSLVAAAVGITVTALTGNLYAGAKGIEAAVGAMVAGAAGGAAGAMTGALLNGANLGQVAKATFTGAFWGGVSGFLNYASGYGSILEQLFKHSFTDAWLEGIQGGNALHGLISGALNTAGNTAIYSKQGLGDIGKIAASAVLGGTVAEIGGGKFANGAITAAYSMMFNDLMHHFSDKLLRKINDAYFRTSWELGSDGFYYKKNTYSVCREIGGEIGDMARDVENSCAIRLSYALNEAGIIIPSVNGTYKGSDGRNYFIKAIDVANYLKKYYVGTTFKTSHVKNAIVFIGKDAYEGNVTGHVDVVFRRQWASKGTGNIPNANYKGKIKLYH